MGEQLDGGAIKQKRSDLKDADQYTTPGTYFVNLWGGVWQNMPTNDCFGLFEVRSYDGYITQRLSAGNGKVFVRIKKVKTIQAVANCRTITLIIASPLSP